jgi:hypothetical protein
MRYICYAIWLLLPPRIVAFTAVFCSTATAVNTIFIVIQSVTTCTAQLTTCRNKTDFQIILLAMFRVGLHFISNAYNPLQASLWSCDMRSRHEQKAHCFKDKCLIKWCQFMINFFENHQQLVCTHHSCKRSPLEDPNSLETPTSLALQADFNDTTQCHQLHQC